VLCKLYTYCKSIDTHNIFKFLVFLRRTAKFLSVRRSLSRNSYGRYPKDSKFQNSEYDVHQVGPKDFGSQYFSFLASIGTELVPRQISATARDRRKKSIAQIMLFSIKSHKKLKLAIFFSFFSSLNQYFPHIPYVASRKPQS
jgi:hypothetical protein